MMNLSSVAFTLFEKHPMPKTTRALFVLIAAVASMAPLSAARAETVYAVNVFRSLLKFDSAAPGTITSSTPITGLVGQNNFESVLAIDFRPATGQLYALGNAPGSIYRLYTVNTTTGVATQVGSDITTISATNVGFDFNPTVDRIRIVTDADQNHRFNPDTGVAAATATNLAFAPGDANANPNPNVVGASYTHNFAAAATTTLYGIDSKPDLLAPPSRTVVYPADLVMLPRGRRARFKLLHTGRDGPAGARVCATGVAAVPPAGPGHVGEAHLPLGRRVHRTGRWRLRPLGDQPFTVAIVRRARTRVIGVVTRLARCHAPAAVAIASETERSPSALAVHRIRANDGPGQLTRRPRFGHLRRTLRVLPARPRHLAPDARRAPSADARGVGHHDAPTGHRSGHEGAEQREPKGKAAAKGKARGNAGSS